MEGLTLNASKSSPSTNTNNKTELAGHLTAAIQQVNGEGLSSSSSVNDVKQVMSEAIMPDIRLAATVGVGAGGKNTQTGISSLSMVKQKKNWGKGCEYGW
jgi:hypothetical protein